MASRKPGKPRNDDDEVTARGAPAPAARPRRPKPSRPSREFPEPTHDDVTPSQESDPTNELTLEDGHHANRRKSTRVPLRVWAENRGWEEFCLWLRAEDIKQDFAFCYRTTDLSSDGVFLETTTPLDVGVEMDLTFRLPGSEHVVHASGEVVRVVGRGTRSAPGMAVRFRELDPASRASLDAFLISRD